VQIAGYLDNNSGTDGQGPALTLRTRGDPKKKKQIAGNNDYNIDPRWQEMDAKVLDAVKRIKSLSVMRTTLEKIYVEALVGTRNGEETVTEKAKVSRKTDGQTKKKYKKVSTKKETKVRHPQDGL
jgi:hypothetical protein